MGTMRGRVGSSIECTFEGIKYDPSNPDVRREEVSG